MAPQAVEITVLGTTISLATPDPRPRVRPQEPKPPVEQPPQPPDDFRHRLKVNKLGEEMTELRAKSEVLGSKLQELKVTNVELRSKKETIRGEMSMLSDEVKRCRNKQIELRRRAEQKLVAARAEQKMEQNKKEEERINFEMATNTLDIKEEVRRVQAIQDLHRATPRLKAIAKLGEGTGKNRSDMDEQQLRKLLQEVGGSSRGCVNGFVIDEDGSTYGQLAEKNSEDINSIMKKREALFEELMKLNQARDPVMKEVSDVAAEFREVRKATYEKKQERFQLIKEHRETLRVWKAYACRQHELLCRKQEEQLQQNAAALEAERTVQRREREREQDHGRFATVARLYAFCRGLAEIHKVPRSSVNEGSQDVNVSGEKETPVEGMVTKQPSTTRRGKSRKNTFRLHMSDMLLFRLQLLEPPMCVEDLPGTLEKLEALLLSADEKLDKWYEAGQPVEQPAREEEEEPVGGTVCTEQPPAEATEEATCREEVAAFAAEVLRFKAALEAQERRHAAEAAALSGRGSQAAEGEREAGEPACAQKEAAQAPE